MAYFEGMINWRKHMELTKEQAERQIKELQDHIDSMEVMVKGGDIVVVDGVDYVVGKAGDGKTALIGLVDGNYWDNPVDHDHYRPISLGRLVDDDVGFHKKD